MLLATGTGSKILLELIGRHLWIMGSPFICVGWSDGTSKIFKARPVLGSIMTAWVEL